MPAKSQLMKLLINSTHIDLSYLEKTKNTIWLNQSKFFQPKNICPNLPPKPPNPTPQKEKGSTNNFSSRFHRAHFAPKELDMTLIALNTSKEQQVKLDPDGMAGQISVVFCFNAETCFFLEEKTWRIEELKLEIEYRIEMFSFCSCSTIDLQLAHTYHPWDFVGWNSGVQKKTAEAREVRKTILEYFLKEP